MMVWAFYSKVIDGSLVKGMTYEFA